MAWDPSQFDEASGNIIAGIASGDEIDVDDLRTVLSDLESDQRDRLLDALSIAGARFAGPIESCDHCGELFAHEDGCPAAGEAGA